APSPRTASLTSGIGSRPMSSAVGWNWTNSISTSAAPARAASARPWPCAPSGLVVWRKRPPRPPVAMTTRSVWSASVPAGPAASTPMIRPSFMMSRRASTSSSTVIDGVRRTAATSARMISLPLRSPPAWMMRCRLCAASIPKKGPSSSPSKRTPCRISASIAPAADAVMRSTTRGSPSPSPAASVSTACSAGVSSLASAAAMPPWARPLAMPVPSGDLASTVTGSGARWSAVISPARPAPITTGWPARCEAEFMTASDREHALDRAARAIGDGGVDGDLALQRFERAADLRQRDPLHVRTKIAGSDEVDLWVLDRNVVAHRAFRHQHDAARPLGIDIACHRRGRAGEIRFGHYLGRAFRMRQHDDAGMRRAQLADLGGAEALMHLAMAGPGDDLDAGLGGNVARQILVRQHDHPGRAERFDDLLGV